MPCLFCDIVSGRSPASIIYQDDKVTAFRDIRPRAPTHILIIPNQHIESLSDITGETEGLVGHVLKITRDLAATLPVQGGYRVVANVGPDSGQSVFHLHFHLLGGRKMGWPPG